MQRMIERLNQMWSEATKEKRVELLQSLGFNGSWAEANTVSEIAKRGGAFVAKELFKLFEIMEMKT